MFDAQVVCQRPARQHVVVCAAAQPVEVASRRTALALAAAALLSVGVVESAKANAAATKSPSSEESLLASRVHGTHRNRLDLTCLFTYSPLAAASMSSFDMEGTKKMGISSGKKAKLMAKVRANAEKVAAK